MMSPEIERRFDYYSKMHFLHTHTHTHTDDGHLIHEMFSYSYKPQAWDWRAVGLLCGAAGSVHRGQCEDVCCLHCKATLSQQTFKRPHQKKTSVFGKSGDLFFLFFLLLNWSFGCYAVKAETIGEDSDPELRFSRRFYCLTKNAGKSLET